MDRKINPKHEALNSKERGQVVKLIIGAMVISN